MLLNWHTRVVVLFFKMGDLRECSKNSGSTGVSLLRKVYSGMLAEESLPRPDLRLRRSSVVFAPAMERWTSSKSLAGSFSLHGSSPNQSTIVLWTWRRCSSVSSVGVASGVRGMEPLRTICLRYARVWSALEHLPGEVLWACHTSRRP